MSRLKCCVPKCLESGHAAKILHTFPNPLKDKDRFNTWLFAIGGEIIGLDNEFIFKQRRVCHRHFEEKYHCRSNRISNNAIPTLHMGALARFSTLLRPLTVPSIVVPEAFESEDTSQFLQTERKPFRELQCDPEPIASTSKDTSQFLQTERKPFRELQCDPEPIASTSKGARTISQQVEKENEPCINLSHANINTESKSQILRKTVKRKQATIPECEAPKKKRPMFCTASESGICKKLNSMRIKLSKLKSKTRKQAASLKVARRFMTNKSFVETIEKLPHSGRLLTLMQFRECKKKEKGRRFSLEEKIIALSIFKQSPKCYRFLRKVFILPAQQTLIKLIQKADVRPGINEKIFQQLKKITSKMKKEHRLCVVLFDEMALKANVTYNERRDKVTGFVTNGIQSQPEFADHAQVYMVRGLVKNYKQAIAYTFSNAATKGPELAKQLKIIIKKLMEAGFIVVGTVCDQGTNNRQAIKMLLEESRGHFLRSGQEPKPNIFLVDSHEIVPMYDPPHLLKCIRNNLITKNLQYRDHEKTREAKWEHIEKLHQENPRYRNLRLIKKLTDAHVIVNKIPKMKVKYASQIFSQTIGGNMGYLADKGVLPQESKDTADILLFFDKLFDSMNGSYSKTQRESKPLLQPVKPNSIHLKFWISAKTKLNSMKFVNKVTKKTEAVPTLKNWAWTLDSIKILLQTLNIKYNVNSVWMRHLNQDPLENFFGAVRSHGWRNTNPTPDNFSSSFTTILINNMSSVHAPGANCENDLCENLHTFIVTKDVVTQPSFALEEIPNVEIINVEEKSDPRIMGPLEYVTGYFVRNSKKHIFKSCTICTKDLVATEPLEYIKYREFAGKQWLYSPTKDIVECLSAIQDIQYCLKDIIHTDNVKEFLKTLIFMHVQFEFITCSEHKNAVITFIINSTSNFFIYNLCKNINKILNGNSDVDSIDDIFQNKAKLYYTKSIKKRKNN